MEGEPEKGHKSKSVGVIALVVLVLLLIIVGLFFGTDLFDRLREDVVEEEFVPPTTKEGRLQLLDQLEKQSDPVDVSMEERLRILNKLSDTSDDSVSDTVTTEEDSSPSNEEKERILNELQKEEENNTED